MILLSSGQCLFLTVFFIKDTQLFQIISDSERKIQELFLFLTNLKMSESNDKFSVQCVFEQIGKVRKCCSYIFWVTLLRQNFLCYCVTHTHFDLRITDLRTHGSYVPNLFPKLTIVCFLYKTSPKPKATHTFQICFQSLR